ncbi:MAG: caspase family protein [Spirosomataceae bacterium]
MMPDSVTISAQLSNDADRARWQAFVTQYPDPAYLWLACHAAFPVALTNDLLYKIWLNFRQDDAGIPLALPLDAVSDVLLSSLCQPIGHNLYEIPTFLRNALWQSLARERIGLLAEFLLQYLHFCRDKIPSDAFAEAQRIWANTFRSPDDVAKLLLQLAANRTTNARDRIMAEYVLSWVKSSKTKTAAADAMPSPATDNLNRAVALLEGIRQYEAGQTETARTTFSSISHLLQPPQTGGFNVPIPKEIWAEMQVTPTSATTAQRKIYAVLVGIDEYGDKLGIQKFSGCVNDVLSWQTILKEQFHAESIVVLLDAKATKAAVVNALQNAFVHLTAEDTLLFTFSGHGYNKERPHFLALYDTEADKMESYLSETEFKTFINPVHSRNPFITVILDTHSGSDGWIDTTNEKQILLSATAGGEISVEVDNKGLLTGTLQRILEENKALPITYRKLIRESFQKIKEANHRQSPQLFGHTTAINQAFLAGNVSQNTYLNELLQITGYLNMEKPAEDFSIESQEEKVIATLEKYALLKDRKRLKVVRISSEMSVRQIPIFSKEYVQKLPYEVDIKDISLFYAPGRAGLKDSMIYEEEIEDDLSALQEAQVIVFILNRALVNDFAKHSSIAPVINHLRRFEYKVVCSVLWEDCDRGDTALRDYPVFSLRQPLSRAVFQKYDFSSEVEQQMEEYYADWQPVINKWITDLAASGFDEELQERLDKAKQTGELDLSGMGFEQLPEAVWALKDLKTIDLYNNKLSELPESLAQFQSLEKLLASKNPITSLPPFLSDLPRLRVLKIDDAQITEFPTWLCQHPALEDISLENSKIEILPSALKDMPKLRLIDFRGNPVINLPASVLKATKGRLKDHIENVQKNIRTFGSDQTNTELLFLSLETERELNTVVAVLSYGIEYNPYFGLKYSLIEDSDYESIFHFKKPIDHQLIVHIPYVFESDSTDINKLSKLFVEYPYGTIFFLNFSNSKQLAELLYQQKHAPIIAFEGELDSQEAKEAVRLFYGHYQESKNAVAAFDNMVLQLATVSTSSKGLYILYRY